VGLTLVEEEAGSIEAEEASILEELEEGEVDSTLVEARLTASEAVRQEDSIPEEVDLVQWL